ITSSTELTVTIADGKAYSKFLSFTDTYTDVVICKDGEDIRIYSGDTGSTLNKLRMNLEPVLDPVEVISTRMGQSLDGDNQFLGNIADMFISAYTIPSSEETLVNYYVIKNPTDRQAAFKRTPPAFDFTVTPWGAEVYNEAGVVDLATSNKFFENEIHTYEQGDYRFISHHVDGENTRPFTYLHKNNYDYSYKGVDSFTSNSLDFFVGDKTKFIPDANAVPPLTIGRLYGTDIPSSTKCITISFWVYKYGCGYNVVDSFYGENEYRNIGSPTSYLRNPITLHNKDIVVGCHFGHRFISNMFHNDANFNLLLNNGWQKVSCTMPNLNHTEQDIFYVKYDPGAQNNHAHGSRFLITGIQIVLDKITTWYDCENYPGESVEVNPNINLIDSDVHTINGSYELDLLPVNSDFTIFGTFNSFENESGKSTDHIADGVLSYNVYTEDRDHYSLFNIVKSGDSNKKQVMFLDHCIDGATEESSYDFKIISDDMNTQTSQTLQSRKNLTFEKTVGPDSDKHGLSCATCSSLGSSFNNTDFTIALRMKQTYWWNGVDWGGTQGYYYIQQYLFSTMTDHASSGAGISLKINNPGNLADGFVLYLQNDAGATQPFYIPLYINHNNEDPILEWNHVVITFNNTTKELNFYLNGEEKLGGATWNNTITGGLQRDFVLGALNNFPSSTMWYNYNGYINDFAIWTEELSPSKVLELNNNVNTDHNTSSSSSNLETWWRMGDGPETKPTQDAVFSLAHDNSGNGNDLLLLARENDTASSPGLPSNGITAGPYWSVEYPGDSSDLVDLNIAKGSEHTFFLEQGAFGEEEINGVLTDWPNYVDTVYEGDSHYYKINDGHTLFYPNTSSDYILEDIDTSDIYKMSLDMRKEHSSYDCRQYVGLAYYDSLGTRIQKHEVYKKPNTYLEIDTGGYLTPINPGDGVRNMCTFKVDISNYDLGGDDSTRFGTFQEKWEYTRDLTGGKWGLYRTYLYAAFNTNPDPDPGSAWDNSDLPNRDVINLGNDLGDGAATDYELCDGGWAECNATDDVV
ncbi:hypothetical protein HN682_02780, partial [Candidatus Peregrinibacteria bacterium]|nr:hypothetical protein [Candidatus Peregrinibacteria bacterium]